MTQHQYEIMKRLRRIMRLKWLLGWFRRKDRSGIITKQAEIELAGQAAAAERPPLNEEGTSPERNWPGCTMSAYEN